MFRIDRQDSVHQIFTTTDDLWFFDPISWPVGVMSMAGRLSLASQVYIPSGNLTVCELENGPVEIVDLPIQHALW